MKHPISRFAVILSLGVSLSAAAVAQQQSLGDAARKVRKNRPAEPTTKVITNEDISSGARSVESSAQSTPASSAASTNASATTSDKGGTAAKSDGKSDAKPSPSADDQVKLDKEWQDKIAAQKDQIALLERELDVLTRENKLRAATFYSDAGNRLRDEKKYAETDRKYRDQVDAKQKDIDAAKAKLEQMKDDGRKAGASPGATG